VLKIISRVALQSTERKRVLVQTCRQSHLSVGRSVCRPVSLGCTVEKRLIGSECRLGWSKVGRWMGVLDGVEIVKGNGAVLGVNMEHPILTNGGFVA